MPSRSEPPCSSLASVTVATRGREVTTPPRPEGLAMGHGHNASESPAVSHGRSGHGAASVPQARWIPGATSIADDITVAPEVDRITPPSTTARAGPGALLASGRRGTAAVLVTFSWPSLARGGVGSGGAVGGLADLVEEHIQIGGRGVR